MTPPAPLRSPRATAVRATLAAGTTLALVALQGGPALAQIPGLPEPNPLDPILTPIEDVIDQIADNLVDIPLDNAVLLGGQDTVDAAIALSQATFEDGSVETALLGRADLFADSLSSSGAQGATGAPLLLTASDGVDDRVVTELDRLGATNVVLLGNETALSSGVDAGLQDLGYETLRIGGETRVETAIDIAGTLLPDATTAIITRAYPAAEAADSQAYVDALAVGPYSAENRWPVLLTQTEVLTRTLRTYLEEEASITEAIIIGGEQAVGPEVEAALDEMGITTRRVAGSNRFGTAVAIASERGFPNSGAAENIILAEGGGEDLTWAPGFAAAANGVVFQAPILLADGLVLPPETLQFILAGLPDNIQDIGGASLLCTTFVNLVACEAAALLLLGLLAEAEEVLGLPLPPELPIPIPGSTEETEEPTPTESPTDPSEEPTECTGVELPGVGCIPPPEPAPEPAPAPSS